MSGDDPGAVGITQRELLMEMRDDIRALRLAHAAGHLEDAVYLERLRELREVKDDVERTTGERVASDRAIDWLRASSATWTEADVPEAKADVLHAIYDQIVVTGREI